MVEFTVATIKKLKVAELKVELTKRELSTKGKKDELVRRLLQATQDSNETLTSETLGDQSTLESSSLDISQDINESQDNIESGESQEEKQSEKIEQSESAQDDGNNLCEKQEQSVKETTNIEKTDPKDKETDPQVEETNVKDEETDSKAEKPTTDSNEKDLEQSVILEDKCGDAQKIGGGENVQAETGNGDDWVMVEAPTAEEIAQQEKPDGGVKSEDVEMKDTHTKKDEKIEESSIKKETDNMCDEKLVEIEQEDGDCHEYAELPDDQVGFDGYTSDLHFVISENGCAGHNLIKNGFSYLWAGARANRGVKTGKVGFEVKIVSNQEVDLPSTEMPINAIRIGWSAESSDLQLGESKHSYGYESTGKVCTSSSFFGYGETFTAGDVIGSYLDLDSEPKTLKYTKNGKDLGVAVSLTVKEEKALFPQVFLRNVKVAVNFGGNEEAWFEPLEEYSFIQNIDKEQATMLSYVKPNTNADCQVLMMIGLPNSGKSYWCRKYSETHPNERFNVVSMHQIMERCKLSAKSRSKSSEGFSELMKSLICVFSKLCEICPKVKRNYIYDQNNVYKIAQEIKMKPFAGFKRKAVIVVPTHDNLRKRTSESKRKSDGHLHEVPFGDLCDMKCEFYVPTAGEVFDEVIFPELDEKNSVKTVADYKSDGERAKRTGRDENYKRRRPRHEERSYGKERYSDRKRERRDEGWKKSGSGYGGYGGGGYYGRGGGYGAYNSGGYGGGYGGGGYKGRGGGGGGGYDRRNTGGYQGGGGYRNNSYGGGGGYKGSSYNSGGYSSNYRGGSGGYGSSNNYGSSGGYGSYNSQSNHSGGYGGSYNQSSNRSTQGGWSQSGSNYNSQQTSQGWSSGQWGAYNSSNSGSYGGGGYNY